MCPAVRCGAVHRGAAAKGLERSQFRGGTKEVLPRRVWRFGAFAVSGWYKRGAAAKGLERSVGPGRGVSGSFEAVQKRCCCEGLEGSVGAGRGVSGSCGAVQ